MLKSQAQQLVKQTFENGFDKNRFYSLIRNLLKRFDESKGFHVRGYVKEKFKKTFPVIKTYERLGTYTDPENYKIDILIVYLAREKSIERARTTLRNFVGDYLKQRDAKDAALVAFVPPSKKDWRFSLVKMEYRISKTKSGKLKAVEELTPAKRFSFLVGEDENSHTAQSRLVPILTMGDETYPTLADFEEAFSVEKVTNEFFEKYRDLFLRVKEELDEILKKDSKVKADFAEKNIDPVDFVKKLLGQIVFLYFLQKKGWFGVARGQNWGSGPKDFLRRLFRGEYLKYRNFFNDVLEPLFYNALSRDRADVDYFNPRFNCKIPFLNGGLFEPIGGYDWVNTDILLPNELFSNNEKTKEGDIGTGILDVFDRYNFTVKEDEPLEKEVAVDPEMLGKIYEKINAINSKNFEEYKDIVKQGRKSKEMKFNKKNGVYYTPPEIVHYMCQQSLIYYLSAELERKVSKEDIEKLIKFGEHFTENEATVLEKGKETRTYKYQLPESIRKNAKLIDDKLRDIKVCDPAVGSGAFPVGMMHEIVKARNVLNPFIKADNRTTYNFKRECIENSLYGVDIDAGACEVAKLRLWLSLIVDEEDIRNIKPLPNLDYKIVQGNSLLGVEKDLFNHELFKQLEKLKPLYFNETNPTKKQEYKNRIEELISKITNGRKEFDFEVYFSEVFHEKSGFDVVIANPPYVRQEKIKEQKILLRRAGYEVYSPRSDLYTYFYERSWEILKNDGFSCFISSNKWMRAKYGENLRRFFKEKTEVINLIDFGGYPVFEATVDTNIILFKKKQPDKEHKVRFVNVKNELGGKDLISFIEENYDTISQEKLDNKCWTLADERILRLKEKIERIGTPLKDWNVRIYFGIKTGFNKAFIIDTKTRDRILAECKTKEERERTKEIIRPILRGRDISRYYYRWAGLWVILAKYGFYKEAHLYPAMVNYLKQYEDKLRARGQCSYTRSRREKQNKDYTGQHHWLELDNNPTDDYLAEFEKEKIVWQRVTQKPRFVIVQSGLFCEATTHFITGLDLKYLLGILDSKIFEFAFYKFYMGGGIEGEIKGEFIGRFPIPPITSQNQHITREIEDLVNKILSLTKDSDYLENPAKQAKVREYERQIDQLVYKLYGLTEKEIRIVEGDA